MIYLNLTVQNIRERTGIDMLQKYPDPTAAQIIIDDATQKIMDYIDANDPYFLSDDCSEAQAEIINRAVVHQVKYVIVNGDLGNLSGLDPISGNMIDQGRLARLSLSEQARQLLENRLIQRMY